MSKELTYDEIVEIENTRPHVVILGAGATMATIPNGDKNGRPCSVMHGFQIPNTIFASILSFRLISRATLRVGSQRPVR